MRKQYYALICVVAIALLLFANCSENPCRYSEVELGMTMDEVRAILGPPEEIDTSRN